MAQVMAVSAERVYVRACVRVNAVKLVNSTNLYGLAAVPQNMYTMCAARCRGNQITLTSLGVVFGMDIWFSCTRCDCDA